MKNQKKIVLILLMLCSGILCMDAQSLTQQVFRGTINGKIGVSLQLVVQNDVVYGTASYTQKGIPIDVIGSLNQGQIVVHELMPDGSITGIYAGILKNGAINGIWVAGNKRTAKDLKLSLKKVSESTTTVTPNKDVTGTYRYSFGEELGTGALLVQQISPTKIAVAFNCFTAGPAFNMAILDKTVLSLKNGEAIYSSNEYGKCKFKISFLPKGAQVSYMDDAYDCGFGNAASTAGSYIKTNSSKPTFAKLDE